MGENMGEIRVEKQDIGRLVDEAVEVLGFQKIYDLSLRYFDSERAQENQPLTQTEFAVSFSVAGFCAGVRFALENLEFQTEEEQHEQE